MSTPPGSSPTPTVSRVLPDGTLIELLYDPEAATTALAVLSPDGAASVVQSFDTAAGERLVPYGARNNLLASGCVKLPSDIGDFGDKGDLLRELKAFVHRYADLTPIFEDIVAHYVLLTWVYDAFNELPYLRFQGDYGSGKTRRLLTIGSLCYKAFFASGASTVSPIFHILDVVGGTLILDEADFRFSDATAELTKVLNAGNVRGLPVLRTMANRHRELNPQAFRVFGPKLIAMRQGFQDPALESRFITEATDGRPLRSDIPIHLPDTLEPEGRALRNKLLAWRFATFKEVRPDAGRLIPGVEPRLNQTSLPLLSLVDDAELRKAIEAELIAARARAKDARAGTHEAGMIAALLEAFGQSTVPYVRVSDVAARFNEQRDEALELPMSPKWVGWFVRTHLRIATTKSQGVFVIPQSERGRLQALAVRFGVPVGGTPTPDAQDAVLRSESASPDEHALARG